MGAWFYPTAGDNVLDRDVVKFTLKIIVNYSILNTVLNSSEVRLLKMPPATPSRGNFGKDLKVNSQFFEYVRGQVILRTPTSIFACLAIFIF